MAKIRSIDAPLTEIKIIYKFYFKRNQMRIRSNKYNELYETMKKL